MIFGVDVSEYVTDVDAAQLRLSGVRFASVKCCDASLRNGIWIPFTDKKHELFSDRFRAESIPTSSYCFCHPSMDLRSLMDYFIAHAYYDQLLLALDLESLSHGQVPDNAGKWTLDAWSYIGDKTGDAPLVYASTSYMRTMIRQCPDLKTVKIWLAEYHGSAAPDSPPHPEFDYVAWQFAGDVKMAGVTGMVDRDVVFEEDLSELYVSDPQL